MKLNNNISKKNTKLTYFNKKYYNFIYPIGKGIYHILDVYTDLYMVYVLYNFRL